MKTQTDRALDRPKDKQRSQPTHPPAPSLHPKSEMAESLYLELKIVKADFLQEAGDASCADCYPYCLVECGKEKQQSHTVQNALSPRFDQTFYFGRGGALSSRSNCKITVVETKTNKVLGSIVLNLGDMVGKKKQSRRLPLENHKGQGRLTVETEVKIFPRGVRMMGSLRKEGGSMGKSNFLQPNLVG